MFLIGLTGGIASGKSTVAEMFKELGCTILDADQIAREVVQPNKPAWKKIVKYFGDGILLEDGRLNRPKLGELVFTDPVKRKKLNSMTHPEIQKMMMWQLFYCFLKGHQFVILDIPLLYETSSMLKFLKEVIVVYCDSDMQLDRLMNRNELSKEEAVNRIESQMPLSHKIQLGDHIIDNTGSVENTQDQVDKLYRTFRGYHTHWILRFVLVSVFATFTYSILGIVKFILQFTGIKK
ncbi:dephospho-CoA kinase domain-containing protein-like [Saccoglossus kowalevskii]|uniref:Dephospho-CoA kinase domain-containing protein-like n=1 Tax=Saccoglossus kowalevskii TaxID=10224 RepID=A0ABM0H0E8_SACKO|nr:PREDICTED: dephospho-CoA kinase domain-containing protein-like [Saccoglossus kowalevskii]